MLRYFRVRYPSDREGRKKCRTFVVLVLYIRRRLTTIFKSSAPSKQLAQPCLVINKIIQPTKGKFCCRRSKFCCPRTNDHHGRYQNIHILYAYCRTYCMVIPDEGEASPHVALSRLNYSKAHLICRMQMFCCCSRSLKKVKGRTIK
jgi:hypothetical protein